MQDWEHWFLGLCTLLGLSALSSGHPYQKGKLVTKSLFLCLLCMDLRNQLFLPFSEDHMLLEGKSSWWSKESMSCPNGPAIPGRIWQRESLTVVAKGTGSLGFAADRLEIWWQGSYWLCVLLRRWGSCIHLWAPIPQLFSGICWNSDVIPDGSLFGPPALWKKTWVFPRTGCSSSSPLVPADFLELLTT